MQRELVVRAKRGDHDAFTRLVDGSVDRLYTVANLILRDADRAQDAVQEALVAAWRDLPALREPDAWDAWLYRLTVWSCYRHAKRDRRRTMVELRAMPDASVDHVADFALPLAERDRLERELGCRAGQVRLRRAEAKPARQAAFSAWRPSWRGGRRRGGRPTCRR